MDRVRFGRALGNGMRETARALVRAADAAAAPNPDERGSRSQPRGPHESAPPTGSPAFGGQRQRIVPSAADFRQGASRFGAGVFRPLRRASGVLWYEFTGTFFGIFALAMAIETWKRRAELRPGLVFAGHAWLAPVLMTLFTWFTISSFLRAARRSRG